MIKYTTEYNVEDLLTQLNKDEIITDNKKEQLSKSIINRHSKQELPLYLRCLLGIGAFITSIFLIVFLWVIDAIPDEEIGMIILGLFFIAGAFGISTQINQKNSGTIVNSFLIQFSFTLMVIGKIFFVLGFSTTELFDDMKWHITLALLLISVATYPIYKISIDRFLSSFAVLCSILINIIFDGKWTLINSLFLFQFIGSAFFLTYPKIKREYIPLLYAFIFSLCTTVLYLQINSINLILINIMLVFGLIALFAWVSGGIKKLKCEPLILASIGTVLLGLISAPGVLLAIGLLVLGYAKNENILTYLGILILPIVLIFYYYNLNILLIQKSIILVGSGILLLLSRLYIKYRQWDKGY